MNNKHIAVTLSVQRRLFEFRTTDLRQRHYTITELAGFCRVTHECMTSYRNGTSRPFLPVYLKLAKFMNWDLSRDVNYIYATRRYHPEGIKYMLRRVFPNKMNITAIYEELAERFTVHPVTIENAVRGSLKASISVYNQILWLIQLRNRMHGYKLDIDLED